jgi:hypothetical protein
MKITDCPGENRDQNSAASTSEAIPALYQRLWARAAGKMGPGFCRGRGADRLPKDSCPASMAKSALLTPKNL